MTTQTEESQVAEGAVSVERALGCLEGKNDLLIRMVDGQGRQARKDNRKLDTKIDTAKSELDAKIDTFKSDIDAKIDTFKSDIDAKIDTFKSDLDTKIDTAKSELDAKIDAKTDRLLYWILGVGVFTNVTIIGSALAMIFVQR